LNRLILIRHGEAGWNAGSDFERPLTTRGYCDAQRLGETLKQSGESFDRIYASPARRTTATAALLCAGLDIDFTEIMQPESLYLASPEALTGLLSNIEEGVRTVAVIGHNPGLSELACKLAREPVNMAPADMIRFDIDQPWHALGSENASETCAQPEADNRS